MSDPIIAQVGTPTPILKRPTLYTKLFPDSTTSVGYSVSSLRLEPSHRLLEDERLVVIPGDDAPPATSTYTVVDGVPRCRQCGYSEADCRLQGDHRLCGNPEPPATSTSDADRLAAALQKIADGRVMVTSAVAISIARDALDAYRAAKEGR